MLCRRVLHGARPLLKKSFSTASPYPFRKLRAFPFGFSSNDAIRYLAPYAAVLCKSEFISSVIARFLPLLGFEPILPKRITPVYFPAWIVDAELKATVNHQSNERTAVVQFENTYLSGSDFQVLSAVSLWPRMLRIFDPVPFNEELLNQHGTDITCIPFNVSPFTVLDAAKSLSYSASTVNEDIRFSPSSVKFNMAAAYPVLIPLYLAQYEYQADGVTRTHTLFMEAYGTMGTVMAEQVARDSDEGQYQESITDIGGFIGTRRAHETVQTFSPVNNCVNVPSVSLSPPRDIAKAIENWLEKTLLSPGNLTQLAALTEEKVGVVTDDDLRIRELTKEERAPVVGWLELSSELMMVNRIREAIALSQNAKMIQLSLTEAPKLVRDADKTLEEQIESLASKRREETPSWWSQWEESTAAKEDR
ncbi:hypothetical protein K443DRAFT_670904 [Laccaria amethystina LaAM-08-1]|uniref:Uncharacterized protein n=1 Tax=Laccaria amethystina LaAM-08-1 TaxID=1095629 RepID=A0A0C9YIX0_9AGAR|nr:hypothetical protein K443DRAFT_670904 [Laccaria amethystina LaAM-08-1]